MARKDASKVRSAAGVGTPLTPERQRELLEKQLQDIQAEKVAKLEQIRHYHDTHRLLTFKPHAKQQLFFDALRDPELRTFVLLGGNRSGKSESAVAAALGLALGRYPWLQLPESLNFPEPFRLRSNDSGVHVFFLPDQPGLPHADTYHPAEIEVEQAWPKKPKKVQVLARTWENAKAFDAYKRSLGTPEDPGALRFVPPVKIRVLAVDMTALEQVTLPKFRKYCAPEWVAAKKKNSFGIDAHWIFSNGSVIDFLTYNQESSMMEGWDGHVCIYDEPPPRSHYIANARGLVDHGGISIFAMTPLREPWIADEIVNKPDKTIWTMEVSIHDNPHITKEFAQEFLGKLSSDELETREKGKFLHLQGLVFKDFKAATHVLDCKEPPPDSTVYAAIDTHPRTPQALAFMWVDKRGNQFVCHEIFRHGTPEEVAAWVVNFHKSIHKIEQVVIDPSAQGDKNRGDSTYEVIEGKLADAGIPLDFGSKDLSSGIQLMQDAFKSKNGIASLFIDRSCTRLLWELGRYIWKDWKNAGSTEKGELNKPRDADDHLIENVRRLIQLPAVYRSPRSAQEFMRNPWKPMDPEAGY